MKIKNILYAVIPSYGNKKANEVLRKKLSLQEDSVALETPLDRAEKPDTITEEQLKEQYNTALKQKDKFEDKAKATIICVTVSVFLMLGASGLLNTLSSRLALPIVQWGSYVLFLYAVLSMITAAVMDIKVLSSENTVFLVPLDTPVEDMRTAYNQYVGLNWAQNSIRNNYVYSAYECIRNALICLFIIMAVAVLPIQDSSKPSSIHNASTIRNYSYDCPKFDRDHAFNEEPDGGWVECTDEDFHRWFYEESTADDCDTLYDWLVAHNYFWKRLD